MVDVFPGTGGDIPPIGDPVMPNDLVMPHAQGAQTDAITGAHAGMLGGMSEEQLTSAVEEMLTSFATAALNELSRTTAGHAQVVDLRNRMVGASNASGGGQASPTPAVVPPNTAGGATASPTPQGASGGDLGGPPPQADSGGPTPPSSSMPEGAAAPADPPQVYKPMDAYREGMTTGEAMTMGSVARKALAPLARSFSENNPNWQMVTLDDGRRSWQRQDPTTGAVAEQVDEGDSNFSRVSRTIRVGAAARSVATGLASGEGLAGTLGAAAVRVAGPVGIAVGATKATGGFFEKQQAAQQPYLEAFGEDAGGAFAARERFGAFTSGFAGFGTIGMDEARKNYARATALGLRGDRRGQATDFMGDMNKRFGMSGDESADIVDSTIKQGSTSLKEFGEAITEVSRSAVAAGRTSKEAIEAFVSAQKTVANNVTGGSGSVEVTKQLSAAAEALPKGLSEALGNAEGLAGMLTQKNVMNLAAQSGQSAMGSWWRMQNPATAAEQVNQTLEQLGQRIVTIMAGALGISEPDLRARVKDATGGQRISEDRQYEVFQQICGGEEATAGVMATVLRSVQGSLGANPNPTKVLSLFFEAVQGTFAEGAEADRTAAAKPISGLDYAGLKTPSNRTGFGSNLSQSVDDKSAIMKSIGKGRAIVDTDTGALNSYFDYVGKTGKGNAAVEGLLDPANLKALEEAGGTDDLADLKYRLNINGKSKEMSLSDIIKGGDQYLAALPNADIVSPNKNDNPASVGSIIKIEIEHTATGPLKDSLTSSTKPSSEQRATVPGKASWSDIPRYGGK